MYTFTKLESEFLRTQLYGPKGGSRRKLEIVKPLLEEELGNSAQARLSELDMALAEIQQFGKYARKLAADGYDENSLEYDLLCKKSKAHSEIADAYMRYCYSDAVSVDKKDDAASIQTAEIPSSWPSTWRETLATENNGKKTFVAPRTSGECMYRYCFFGLWDDGEAKELKMHQQLEDYRKFSDNETQLAVDKEFADAWLKKARELLKKAEKSPNDTEIELQAAEMRGPLLKQLQKLRANAKDRKERKKTMNAHKVIIHTSPLPGGTSPRVAPISRVDHGKCVYSGHCNDIFLLSPAREWELFIDESAPRKGDENYETGGKGVIAGVLTDLSCRLPDQPQLHVSQDKSEEQLLAADKVVETILNHPQTGVLAIPARAYRNSGGWGSLIVSFVDLVLRMLPLNGKTTLTVFVEGRSPYENVKDFTFMRDACRYQLMHTLPERAALIDFDIRKMDKTHPCNAYPDLVSHTCCMNKYNPVAKARFYAARWGGSCFLNYDAMQLCNLLDYYHAGRLLPVADWDALIREQRGNDNFVAALLQTFGEEVKNDADLWQSLLNACLVHLNSKAIKLCELGHQIDFLKSFQPDDTKLPPRVRLLWLTAKLAEANHRGVAVIEGEKEFMELIDNLFEEDAPLACFAVLHLSVTRTNAYQFKEANELLESFFRMLMLSSSVQMTTGGTGTPFDLIFNPRCPHGVVAIPGAKYFAQLVSSHGQYEAFMGRNDSALRFFAEAIRRFRLLSDTDAAKLDISQTSAYLLTSLMDVSEPDPELFERALREYFRGDLIVAARQLATDDSPENKYRHHILLRFIHSGKAAPEVKNAYLAEKENWAFSEDGHPWEMIAFYRALLLNDREERVTWLQKAFALTNGSDATLHVIGTVILGAILLDNESMTDEYNSLVKRCAKELPDLGDRLIVLQEQPQLHRQPLELAKLVLPFNFR